jgi:hypothetical protein
MFITRSHWEPRHPSAGGMSAEPILANSWISPAPILSNGFLLLKHENKAAPALCRPRVLLYGSTARSARSQTLSNSHTGIKMGNLRGRCRRQSRPVYQTRHPAGRNGRRREDVRGLPRPRGNGAGARGARSYGESAGRASPWETPDLKARRLSRGSHLGNCLGSVPGPWSKPWESLLPLASGSAALTCR